MFFKDRQTHAHQDQKLISGTNEVFICQNGTQKYYFIVYLFAVVRNKTNINQQKKIKISSKNLVILMHTHPCSVCNISVAYTVWEKNINLNG